MEFKIGQIVKHKLNDKKYVVNEYHPVRWYRKYAYYRCSSGDPNTSDYREYFDFYESDLEVVKK